ncbi:MAG: GTPase HflX [Candidatus Peregrinibacteria bacterium]|nr:GTPase HflX [Candidatus Peregrinibacteria bacterium]
MKKTHQVKEKMRAILVDVIDSRTPKAVAEKRLIEMENLVNTYGGIVVMKAIQKRGLPDYDTYIGKGKLEEIMKMGEEIEADILIINNILKPKQVFNIDEALSKINMKSWDRVDLILKIFDKHATTTEAKLQIELAAIKHMGPRIYNMGIELSQQAGARGTLGGSGETNIEIMKRHLQGHELTLLKKLEHYELINKGHRDRRKRQNFQSVAIVGYTNAGKSSLLNALTGKELYIADELFATLDTRVAKIYIKPETNSEDGTYIRGRELMLSDTIGFIQDLPPDLIQAFKSTLAEAIAADLILHTIDINDPDVFEKIEVVEDILKQLGLQDRKKIYVFNKVDLLAHRIVFEDEDQIPEMKREGGLVKAGAYASHMLGWTDHKKHSEATKLVKELSEKYREFQPVFVSAHQRVNLEKLIKVIDKGV